MKKSIKKILSFSAYGAYEYFRDLKASEKKLKFQENFFKNYLKDSGKKKLQIGCGSNLLEDWLNTDLNWSEKVAYLDAGKKFPLPDSSFDFIYSEHLFEHLDESQQLNMLSECYRILKTDGVLRIATPSLSFLFNIYSNPDSEVNKAYTNWAMRHSAYLRNVKKLIPNSSYYQNYVINHFFKAWGHQMIHNKESLSEIAIISGFLEVNFYEVGKSDFEELENLEKHATVIPEEMNILETMVVELRK